VSGGAGAAGAWAGGAADGAEGRLLTSRDGRGGASGSGAPTGAPGAAVGGAASLRAGAFFNGEVLGAVELDAVATALFAGAEVTAWAAAAAAGAGAAAGSGADVTDLAALVAFLAGAGSSGWTGRRRPSASALRRTRSACASSMEDE